MRRTGDQSTLPGRTIQNGGRSLIAAAVLAVLATASPLHAQRLGVVVGGTFSQLSGLNDVSTEARSGTMFGATLLYPLGNRISAQGEALFVNKGSKLKLGSAGTQDVQLDYMEIPMLLRFDKNAGPGMSPHLYLGPSIGFNVGCSVTTEGTGVPKTKSDCTRENFDPKSFDWSAIVGAGVDLTAGGLGVTAGVRYGVGLANVANAPDPAISERVRNGTLTVYAGILLGRR